MRRFSRSERTGKKQTETGRLFSLAIRRREHAAAVYQHCSFDFEKERKARGSGERGATSFSLSRVPWKTIEKRRHDLLHLFVCFYNIANKYAHFVFLVSFVASLERREYSRRVNKERNKTSSKKIYGHG